MNLFSDVFNSATSLLFLGIAIPVSALFFLGLVTAVLQAVTQVQDQVLGFFPKILLSFLIIFFGTSPFLGMVSELLVECLQMVSKVK